MADTTEQAAALVEKFGPLSRTALASMLAKPKEQTDAAVDTLIAAGVLVDTGTAQRPFVDVPHRTEKATATFLRMARGARSATAIGYASGATRDQLNAWVAKGWLSVRPEGQGRIKWQGYFLTPPPSTNAEV